jgi:hypothetical protein
VFHSANRDSYKQSLSRNHGYLIEKTNGLSTRASGKSPVVGQELEQSSDVKLRLSSRRPQEVERLRGREKRRVFGSDDPQTFL